MSTLIEDRLTAALHARAELVQPEDLGHQTPPPPSPTPIWRRPAVVALVAAAAVVAVAVPVVLRSDHSGHQHPQPSDHFPIPEQRVVHSLSTDLDADGKRDQVDASGNTVTVRLAADPAHPVTVLVHRLAGLVGVVATGRPAPALVVALRNKQPSGRNWTAYQLTDGRLEPVTVQTGPAGSSPESDGLVVYGEHAVSWITSGGALMTGTLDPAQDGQSRLAVHVSRFLPGAGALQERAVGQWCWDVTHQSLPAPCAAGVSYGFNPGPHGSLPALLPSANPDLLGRGFARTWDEGGTRLRVVKGPHRTADPYQQVYEVVGTIDGQHVSAPIGVGNVHLFKTYVDLGHGVRGLAANVVSYPWTLLSVTDHGLVPAKADDPSHGANGQFFLRPGTMGLFAANGPPHQAVTWIAAGKVFTRVETGTFDHFRTYEWQVTNTSGTTLTPVDLGVVCMDDFQATYGTCS